MLKRGMKLNHPGQIVKSMCFDPLGLTLTEAAKNLGGNQEIAFPAYQWTSGNQCGNGLASGKSL